MLDDLLAIVLAGGRGTRLGANFPKCLAPIGPGRFGGTVLGHVLGVLNSHGVRTTAVAVDYGRDLVLDWMQREDVSNRFRPMDITAHICVNRGTACVLREMAPRINHSRVVFLNGDTLLLGSFSGFLISPMGASPGEGVLKMATEDGRGTGVLLFNHYGLREVISYLDRCRGPQNIEDVLSGGLPHTTVKVDCEFLDLGTRENLGKAPEFLRWREP